MPPIRMTELRKNGADLNRLKSDRQRRFALIFAIGKFGPKEAAIAAGYDEKSASRTANKLLNNPIVKAFIGKAQRQDVERLELDREEVLRQLWYALTRDIKDFLDKSGEILNPTKMSNRARAVIDGLDQTVYVNGETGDRTVKTKLRLTSKVAAIDLAMKHKGLFQPDALDVKVSLAWDELRGKDEVPCPIERAILDVESSVVEDGHADNN